MACTMSDTVVSPTTMSGRAGIAMLTLKLRAAQQDADRAEAAADAAEHAAEHELAAAESDTSVEQRTRALEAELGAALEAAAALVAAAHAEAAKIAAMAPPIAAAPLFMAEVPVVATTLVPPPPGTAVAVTHSAGFDAEVFATVFATVFAAKFDEHLSARNAVPMVMPGYAMVPQMQPKPSFWQHAKHLDVVLIGLAAAIVVTVMFAWMG